MRFKRPASLKTTPFHNAKDEQFGREKGLHVYEICMVHCHMICMIVR